ncbi:hypothetical protein CF065_01050 [Clostridium sporogenes]|uniref:hypothetical protein n=1 Tax=Clostridium TaxID=1485 RepID=UPI0022374023|nr:hypothetical protein [Clostridium sporogenes]MCW6077268.1 hypothetical protein [Clostridium sporogenes]
MKNKFKSLVTALLIVFSIVSLTACGKSLSKTLTSDSGEWQCSTSEGDNIKITFFENGKSTIEEKNSSEDGSYKIENSNINFLDDKGKIITSIKNAKIDGDTIKGTLTSINSDRKSEIIMNKVK